MFSVSKRDYLGFEGLSAPLTAETRFVREAEIIAAYLFHILSEDSLGPKR